MNKDLLRESRLHGNMDFPIGIYTVEQSNSEVLFDHHWHEEMEFLLIIEGTAIIEIGTNSFRVAAKQAVFINSGEIHSAYATGNTPCIFYAIVFNSGLLAGNPPDIIKSKYIDPLIERKYVFPIHIKNESTWENDAIAKLEEIVGLYNSKPFAYELLIKSHLYIVLSIILSKCNNKYIREKSSPYKSEILKKVIQYIHTYYNTKIVLSELASQANMSEGHFCRFFKQQFKQTPVSYINYYRTLKAASLLKYEDKKVLEIALETGFESFSYFIVIFKQYMKCTPSEYRKRIRETQNT